MRTVMLLVLIASLVPARSHAQAMNGSDAESKIILLERLAKMQAYQGKDLKTLDAIFEEHFVDVDANGRLLSKPEFLAYIQSIDSVQVLAEAMAVSLHGDTAVVTGLYRMKGVERGKPFLRRGRFVDTWLFKNGRWVEIAGLSTPGGI